jgi:hypothetical protein
VGFGLSAPGVIAAPGLLVGPERQGAVSGLVNSVIGTTFVAGPLLSTVLYEIDPATPVLAAFGAATAALALAGRSPAAREARAAAKAAKAAATP